MYALIPHGRRLAELQKWRHLRFVENASSFYNSFSSATADTDDASPRDGRKGKNSSVSSYLVDSLGLSAKLAGSISRKVESEGKGNPDSVLNLLRSHGFSDSQISGIITDHPKLLTADVEKSIGPKLKFLQSRGASTSELTQIVSKVPKILGIKKDKAISIYYDFVKEIIEADKSPKFKKLSLSLPQGSKQENKIRNLSVLRELGVPQKHLFSLLISNFQFSGKGRFEESLKRVLEMGFDPTTSKFVGALNVVYGWSDKTIEEKFKVLKKLGFTVSDVWDIFKKHPIFLRLSEKKILNSIDTFLSLGLSIDEVTMVLKCFPRCLDYSALSVKKKAEFLVEKMNWPLKALALHPQVFSYSMEKRIVPRCNVIKLLISRGSELPPLPCVLACTDELFLKRYVRKHDDKELVAELMAIFTGAS